MIDLNKLAKPHLTIRKHTDDLLKASKILYELNYIDERTYNILNQCCEYHDYGKINQEFQKRVRSKKKIYFDNEKEVAHNVLSLLFIDTKKFKNKLDFQKVCYAVLNHHHNTNNFKEIDDKVNLISEFQKEYDGFKIKRRLKNSLIDLKTDRNAQLLKGLLHKCDYSASGDYVIEYKADFLEESLENFIHDAEFEWNDLQKFCIKNRNENLIVVANTGMGKTEAGLLWIGNKKGFFILPLRTAINAIYSRVSENIVKDNLEERVALLHSETLSQYLKKNVTEEEAVLEYSKRGKQLSMPLTISTLDQLFSFVYKYHGFELKLATLSYSKIVIDEIQAYSPDLLAYLVLGLEKITELGGKFAILTATLPPFVKDYLEEKIGQIKSASFTNGIDRHNIKVIESELDIDFIFDHYNQNFGKTLIVCNTVRKAQEVYELLNPEDKRNDINLIHAKFTKKDRAEKEEKIMNFGETEITANGIWIATSIVEASLDLDFDYLFTELNDLNGFFQRLGRVNRKGIKHDMLDNPNAFIFTEIPKGLLRNKDGRRGFIDETIYNLSKEALTKQGNGILSESQKVKIIEEYLTSENIKSSNFAIQYSTIKKYIDDLYIGETTASEVQKQFRNIISYNVIPQCLYEKESIRNIIEENLKIINQSFKYNELLSTDQNKKLKDKIKTNQAKAKDKIMDYVVSVGLYDLNKIGNPIDLGYEKIEIIKCDYSEKKGFKRIKKEKQEDEYDIFL